MLARKFNAPSTSILLLGPRGTGKSTWISQNFSGIVRYDLLDTAEVLRLSKDPGLLYREQLHKNSGEWVIIDEIQKVPLLLNEVQRLIEEKKLKFILCGSSARKLKQKGTNLLAGRARLAQFFPLVSAEANFEIVPSEVLRFGLLPAAFTQEDPQSYLKSYAEVYLSEEIKAEALAQNIGHFSRFLEVAARQNGQLTNASAISRDAQVSRQTVQGYFDILVDTLMGSWLQPWKLKRSTKQVGHPKFYFFDCGVARALSGRLPYPPSQEESGPLLETWLLHELKAFFSYSKLGYPVYFWSSPDGVEVDFLFETKKGFVAIESKVSSQWEGRYHRGLLRIREELGPRRVKCFGVYLGLRRLTFDYVQVLPAVEFLKKLWDGDFS